MLFQYLVATVALAASVISTLPPMATKPAVTLEKCQSVITEVKQPVVASCAAGKVEEVKSHLIKAQKPVQTLSTTFNYTSTLTVQKEVVTKYSYEFIKVLTKFQAVLTVIFKHPKIKSGCTEVYAKFDYHFDSICTVFKKHGVEIYKHIHAEASLDLTIWEKSGFTFHKKGGYGSSGSIGH